MLHSIQEICDLTNNSRSSIYAMLNEGKLSYVVGQDGKRKVETSELFRVFPEISLPQGEQNIDTSPEFHLEQPPKNGLTDKQEIYELRGMINELKEEISNVLDDNRCLLRLLEHQTLQSKNSRPPATEIAQDWKDYKKMRESGVGEDREENFVDRLNRKGGFIGMVRDFFFGSK